MSDHSIIECPTCGNIYYPVDYQPKICPTCTEKKLVAYRDVIDKVKKLISDWEKYAQSDIPDDYKKRNLEYKFLRGNNIYAGYHECADDLRDVIDELEVLEKG